MRCCGNMLKTSCRPIYTTWKRHRECPAGTALLQIQRRKGFWSGQERDGGWCWRSYGCVIPCCDLSNQVCHSVSQRWNLPYVEGTIRNPSIKALLTIKVLPVPIILGHFNNSPASQRNIPTDTSVMSLFDTSYVYPIFQKSPLIWNYYDFFVKRIFQLITGTKHGHDQWSGVVSENRHNITSSKFPTITCSIQAHIFL